MPSIEIFRTGTFTSSQGKSLEMTPAKLAAVAACYDPSLSEAPAVVGHPRSDAPAHGWVKGLRVDGDRLVADFDEVAPGLVSDVKARKFKKISASFFLPDTPNNPTPGQLYLRHVGFLGASTPAVKGLRPINFADDGDGVADFTDWNDKTVVRLFRGLRDLLVEKFGLETADKVLPSGELNWLQEDTAVAAAEDARTASPTFLDPQEPLNVKTKEELAAEEARLTKERETLQAQQAAFADEQAKARAKDAERASIDFVDGLVKEGKFLPANRSHAVAVMGALAAAEGTLGTLDFADGDGKPVKASPLDAFKHVLASMPKVVELGEVAGGAAAADFADDPDAIAAAASDHIAAEAAKGRTVSAADAVRHVSKGAAA